ncbi:MAG TPA: TraB/GumN family protein [Allosphingosinicella sp.]|jgi:hypothetical protein|nr:TraB/GumN family protein [Allosphingosinicella sp.]
MTGGGFGKALAALVATALALAPGGAAARPPAGRAAPAQASAQADAMRHARPALWLLKDEDTRIYLFGTIHALPGGIEWNQGAVAEALAAADELVLESDVASTSFGDLLGGLMTMMAVGQPPILERVQPGLRPRLRDAIEASLMPMSIYDRMKTWAVVMSLADSRLEELGIESDNGVERGLTAAWTRRGRRVMGLESAADQSVFLDGIPEATQRRWLEAVLAEEDDAEERGDFDEALLAWARGDVEAIARLDADDPNDLPEIDDVLLRQRNARWVEWLRSRLERPGVVFFAVGAAHLTGEHSLQTMLAGRGLRAERLQ